MKIKLFLSFLLVFVIAPALGQFKSDLPIKNISDMITGGPATNQFLFDPSKIQMNHNFSMSLMNIGGQSVSVGAYTNSFSMALTPNLSMSTQFSLVKPTVTGIGNNGQVFYGVGLLYKPTEHSSFSFQMNNYPTYYRNPNQHLYLRGY